MKGCILSARRALTKRCYHGNALEQIYAQIKLRGRGSVELGGEITKKNKKVWHFLTPPGSGKHNNFHGHSWAC